MGGRQRGNRIEKVEEQDKRINPVNAEELKDKRGTSALLNNIGLVYNDLDKNKALEYFQKSLAL